MAGAAVTAILATGPQVIDHRYEPWGAAHKLFHDRSAEVLLSGPAGTGKTRACLEKLLYLALLNPGMRGLIVRKVAADLASTALVTWKEHVAHECLALGICAYQGQTREKPAGYAFSNGSFIAIGGMNDPGRIMSTEYDVIYVQEAIQLTITDWENCTTRLRNGKISFNQLIADTNPDAPTHWLKQRAEHGTTRLYESRHEDNPLYFTRAGEMTPAGRDYIAGKLDKMTGVRLKRLRKGLWVAAEGQVYEAFDPAVHCPTIPEIAARHNGWPDTRLCAAGLPWHWDRYYTIDFGFTNPTVIQRWAEDDDGRLYLYGEQYRTQRLVEDHVNDLKKITQKVERDGTATELEPAPRAVICDHDAEDRATFTRHYGSGTASARKDVSPGIQAVQERLKIAGDGLPRLFLIPGARWRIDTALREAGKPTSTLEEVVTYVWDREKSPEGKNAKENPLKEDDHGMDAKRYMVAYRDLGWTKRKKR